MVECTAPCINVKLVVAHAPTANASKEDKDLFWSVFTDVVNVEKQVVVLLDANVRAPLVRQLLQGAMPTVKNPALLDNACRMHEMLMVSNLTSKAFCEEWHHKLKNTWKHNASGSWFAINYLLMSTNMDGGILETGIFNDFDNLSVKIIGQFLRV